MNITLKLYASLRDYLPAAHRKDNRIALNVDASITPYAVLDQFSVPRALVHLVLVNGVYLYPPEREQATLKEGDVLAVWPPVGGG